ncbi:glycosyl transferase family 1 [Candidatus Pacearchaeota archaeon CG10_big_fil_rev_8_21_14_0_10_30_48]|nr:MAG: glycosyl transferase family 1 [Candidatus Pacearchaeota archaeon CG10_big_fil_rev_8_21_14_0_10_30_48]
MIEELKNKPLKILVLYPHPPEPDGVSMQGHYLIKGLRELGAEVMPCDRADNLQKLHSYKAFNPDVTIGIGYWGDSPEVLFSPMNHGLKTVPWFNADGWVANYHDILNNLPLIVATSNWVKSTYMRDGVKGDNIYVCPIGFDSETFYPISKSDEKIKKLRDLLGIKDDEKMIFTAGGDVTSKGAQEMFKALAKIDKDFPNWKYVLKTYDSSSAENHGVEEEQLIEELGLDKNKIIRLSGKYTPEFMAMLLNACDIYAAPSRLEGFGMIQLEAQACGKPVISINVGGPKDVIIHEKTGFLVDVATEIKLDGEWAYDWMGFEEKHMINFPNPKTFAYRADINQLAEYTLKLLVDDSLRESIGREATKHALDNFHYKVTAKKMLDLIKGNVLKLQ